MGLIPVHYSDGEWGVTKLLAHDSGGLIPAHLRRRGKFDASHVVSVAVGGLIPARLGDGGKYGGLRFLDLLVGLIPAP